MLVLHASLKVEKLPVCWFALKRLFGAFGTLVEKAFFSFLLIRHKIVYHDGFLANYNQIDPPFLLAFEFNFELNFFCRL